MGWEQILAFSYEARINDNEDVYKQCSIKIVQFNNPPSFAYSTDKCFCTANIPNYIDSNSNSIHDVLVYEKLFKKTKKLKT